MYILIPFFILISPTVSQFASFYSTLSTNNYYNVIIIVIIMLWKFTGTAAAAPTPAATLLPLIPSLLKRYYYN